MDLGDEQSFFYDKHHQPSKYISSAKQAHKPGL